MNKGFFLFFFLIATLLLSGCAGKRPPQPAPLADSSNLEAEEPADWAEPNPDSWPRFNHGTFAFNDAFLTHVFTPVNTVYTGFFSPDMRNGFSNFYRNLTYPVRLVNALLQFKFTKVGAETASFALNTVFGWAGLFNVTRNMPALQQSPEDFAQTLAYYGLDSGSYLVLPLLGPSSLRDAFGLVVDIPLNPLFWIQPDALKYSLSAHKAGNTVSANLPTYNTLKAESLDHYTSMKDAYFQYRAGLEHD